MFNWFKKKIPTRESLQDHKILAKLYHLLHYHYLWHFNRHSVSKAIAIGSFFAFIPVPFQMIPAALCALVFRANVGISIATVWISNPITIPPMIYAAYKLGSWMIGHPGFSISLEQPHDIIHLLSQSWPPFLLGCITLSITFSLINYIIARLFYRLWIIRKWRKNREKHKQANITKKER
ncbi:hypothetical protein PsalMR5_01832 [Piscirickettsia salmonis]|uniref:DUF2062 domain-containing protein n=1 Tax=Piscirickettsia salmonis TaxID=1238 RepID=UPI0012BA6987|nr:DUF2062 domain-containing protein [Piscirickettsia salmonis]QGP54842.1 hypothetical protein PsalSR1_02283 [Piscirickettsia salmonis]QGP59266.1 hypothetical protein PsalBI1_01853 [Piscirickettsia salmonis]QGP63968.1 hypothetical protein PsalMR5_01832 [Piscirickettsia salmonis]